MASSTATSLATLWPLIKFSRGGTPRLPLATFPLLLTARASICHKNLVVMILLNEDLQICCKKKKKKEWRPITVLLLQQGSRQLLPLLGVVCITLSQISTPHIQSSTPHIQSSTPLISSHQHPVVKGRHKYNTTYIEILKQ